MQNSVIQGFVYGLMRDSQPSLMTSVRFSMFKMKSRSRGLYFLSVSILDRDPLAKVRNASCMAINRSVSAYIVRL